MCLHLSSFEASFRLFVSRENGCLITVWCAERPKLLRSQRLPVLGDLSAFNTHGAWWPTRRST